MAGLVPAIHRAERELSFARLCRFCHKVAFLFLFQTFTRAKLRLDLVNFYETYCFLKRFTEIDASHPPPSKNRQPQVVEIT